MIDGYEFLKTTRNVVLEGKFPNTTLPDNPEVVFKIKRKGPLVKALNI